MKLFDNVWERLKTVSVHSAWQRGVLEYAMELCDDARAYEHQGYINGEDMKSSQMLHKTLLNGASNWGEYSWGGCSLIYNEEIAKRLCNPTELKKCKNGSLKPNQHEQWLDTQARALQQAEKIIQKCVKEYLAMEEQK